MTKTQEQVPQTETVQPSSVNNKPVALPSINSFESVLQQYGITPETSYVPLPPTVQKQNLDQLCILTTPIFDERGETIKNVIGHSGPVMFLEKAGEKDGDKFSGYDGFYIYYLLHPKKGKIVTTIGRPADDKVPAIVQWLDTLKAGAWFQVASIRTGSNYHTFQPVPVQQAK